MRGAKLEGIRYERRFGRFLKKQPGVGREAELLSSQWFEFEDGNGPGWAQTDHILVYPGVVVVFECKLSQHPHAEIQLTKLYRPLVESVWNGYQLVLVEVFKNMLEWLPEKSIIVTSLEEARSSIGYNAPLLWNWRR